MKQGFQHMRMSVHACMRVGGVWVYTLLLFFLSTFLEAAVDHAHL